MGGEVLVPLLGGQGVSILQSRALFPAVATLVKNIRHLDVGLATPLAL